MGVSQIQINIKKENLYIFYDMKKSAQNMVIQNKYLDSKVFMCFYLRV
jgi:hypothetical protein